jgi:4-amino-4-deoxy-L-arabinose transferase-like glycosyltransferase
MTRRRLVVAAILLAALLIRLGYIADTTYHPINDGAIYNRLAGMIDRTGDYYTGHRPGTAALGSRGPVAYFPPAFPYTLAAADRLTGHASGGRGAVRAERVEQALTGTLTVGLIGLVALEAFGAEAALAALILAAVYPVFVELAGILAAENLLLVFELAATWMALRAGRSAHPRRWVAGCGAMTGLATLTHQNAILLLIPFAVAATRAVRPWRGLKPPRAPAVGAVALLIVTTLVVIAPWTIRNALVVHRFLPVSDETGITLVGTYNPASAAFRPVPYKWRILGQIPRDRALGRHAGRYAEAELSARMERQALDYISAHPFSPLVVSFDNTLRMFELEGSYAWHASAKATGLGIGTAGTGVIAFWVVCLLALVGLLTRRARAAPLWLWGVPVLLALSVVVVNVETPRFREPVDPFLVMLAACGLAALIGALPGLRDKKSSPGEQNASLGGRAAAQD